MDMKQTIKILHLTDLHLFGDQQARLVGIDPLQTLERTLTKILDDLPQKRPELIVLTGDISQDYSLASYQLLTQMLRPLSCTIAVTMGNHEHQANFTQVLGEPTSIVNGISPSSNWRILLLNSHWPEHVAGILTEHELVFLEKNLELNSKQSVIIFLHHHVLPVGSFWLDQTKLQNSAQFLAIITKYPNVKAVVCGHVHQATMNQYQDITFLSTPATSCQFVPKSHGFKLDNLMPGYRFIELDADGTLATEVIRIAHDATFVPTTNSKGYH